jgi:hypothetical protein
MRVLLIISLASIFPAISFSQNLQFDWALQMGGSGGELAYVLKIDNFGNLYTTGFFSGKCDFDPGEGTYYLYSDGKLDIFISKLDSIGNFKWARRIGGGDYDLCDAMAIDNFGNVYTTGRFGETIDFDPDTGIYNMTSSGVWDCFISKLDSSGNLIWAKQFKANSWSGGYGIDVDDSSNVYISGMFNETTDFDPGSETYNLISAGYDDTFICKLNKNGEFVWAKQLAGSQSEGNEGIEIDNLGNIIVIGDFAGTTDFDPGEDLYPITSIGGERDLYILKLSNQGEFIWVKSIQSANHKGIHDINCDIENNIFITGFFSGFCEFDPLNNSFHFGALGSRDVFIEKMDQYGDILWVRRMSANLSAEGLSIITDQEGNAYITGYSNGEMDFNPDYISYIVMAHGNHDIFINKVNPDGHFRWGKVMGGPSMDEGLSVAVNDKCAVFTAGHFHDSVDFDVCTWSYYLNSFGAGDIFIQKMSQDDVGISEIQKKEILIYPNPVHDQLQIKSLFNMCIQSVEVYNIQGKRLKDHRLRIGQNTIPVNSLPEGVYVFKLYTNKGIFHEKIMKN